MKNKMRFAVLLLLISITLTGCNPVAETKEVVDDLIIPFAEYYGSAVAEAFTDLTTNYSVMRKYYGHKGNSLLENTLVEKDVESVVEAIAAKDEETLFSYFSLAEQEAYGEELRKEISEALASIDGDIINEYTFNLGSGSKGKKNFLATSYMLIGPRLSNVKTTTGKVYTIDIWYLWRHKADPTIEGIIGITIYEEGTEEDIIIGDSSYVYEQLVR